MLFRSALLAVGWITIQRLLPKLDISMVFRWSNVALSALAAWFTLLGIAELLSVNS